MSLARPPRYQPLFGSAQDPSYFFEVKFDVLHRFEIYYGIWIVLNLALCSWVVVTWINKDQTNKLTTNSTCDAVFSDIDTFALVCIISAAVNAVLVLALPVMLKARLISALVMVLIAAQALLTVVKAASIGMASFCTLTEHLNPVKCGVLNGLYSDFALFTYFATTVTFSELLLGYTFLYAIGLMDLIYEATNMICPGSWIDSNDDLNKFT